MEQRENKFISTLSLLAMIKKGISADKISSIFKLKSDEKKKQRYK